MRNDKADIGDWGIVPSPVVQVIWNIILALITIVALTPVLWMISTTFKPSDEIFTSGLQLIPRNPTLDHFRRLWASYPMMRIIFNTFVVATTITLSQVITSVLAAYGFARYRFPLREPLFIACIVTMFIPIQVIMVSNYLLMSKLGWLNSYIGVVAPQLATAYGIFLLRQHLRVFPQALLDAARLDGANEVVVLARVVLPVIRPVLTALAVLLFINNWNQYVWPTLVLNDPWYMTLPIWLRQFMHVEGGADWGLLMSGSFLGVVPALVIYFLAHNQIMNTFAASGLKG